MHGIGLAFVVERRGHTLEVGRESPFHFFCQLGEDDAMGTVYGPYYGSGTKSFY